MTNNKIAITYYDTAMMLIEVGGLRFLTDPLFDESGSDYHHGPVHLHKTSTPLVTPTQIGSVDAVLLSHDQHADNLDNGGRAFLPHAKVVLTTPEGAARLGGNARPLVPWQKTDVTGRDGFKVAITAMPAQHGPDGTLDATGSVTGFLLEWEGQKHGGLYISGDTIPHAGTVEIARRYRVGTAILHIGSVTLAPMGDLLFSMSALQAVSFARDLGAKILLPIHCEGWAHFSEGQARAREVFEASEVKDRVHWLVPGQATEIEV